MANISDLLGSMKNYDETTEYTQAMRKALIERYTPDVLKLDMSVNKGTDPELYASQTRFFSEYNNLLNHYDTAARNHTSVKLKNREIENTANIAFSAAEFLSKIKLTDKDNVPGSPCLQSKEEVDALISKQFEESGSIILDSELEEGNIQLPSHREDDIY